VCRFLVTANVVYSLTILVTLLMEALRFFETSVLIRATRRKLPADGILHSHRRENLKSDMNTLAGGNVYKHIPQVSNMQGYNRFSVRQELNI
jgi:hypothetical protein